MNKKHTLISRKAVALICLLSVIIGAFSVLISAAEYRYDTPLEPAMWEEPNFDDPDSYAYSFAFVGDTQCLMIGDRLNSTDNVNRLYKYIAGTAEERKLEHVFVLGDITEVGYWNDYNMVNAAKDWPMVDEEWEIAQNAIFQLNGKVNYSLCRGNHDDYMMDDYFNVPAYTDQFKGNGGFFSDTGAKYPGGGRNQTLNPTGTVYWSAKTGAHDETIANSWRTMEICGTKYLFVTVDYNPSAAVANWLDETLARFPDHKAIITTHSYMKADGSIIPSETGEVYYPSSYGPAEMWNKVYSKHANVFMIVCGHATKANIPIYTIDRGQNGNKIYQFLINPQTYDLKEARKDGESPYGTQDQGLVMYMNFSEDGKTISLNYYSTLLNKFLKGANYTINVEDKVNENGSVDMAGFSDFGQVTPLVTDKKTATLDGVINENEYSFTKVTGKKDIASGSISSDITEYYAYDNDYIYYALKTKSTNCSMSLHLGNSLYYLKDINSDLHSKQITVTLADSTCKQKSNDGYSFIVNNQDMYCRVGKDTATNSKVYELKISREYLKNNGAPDNALSYTLDMGTGKHYFNITDDAKVLLAEAGVEKSYDWTYNYVYFGTRPEVSDEPLAEVETDPVETEEVTTGPLVTEPSTQPPVADSPETDTPSEEKKSGCASSVSVAGLALIISLGSCTALVARKKKQ